MRPRMLVPLLAALAALALACQRSAPPPQAPSPAPGSAKTAPAPAPSEQAPAETERSARLTAGARLLAGLPVAGGEPWASIQAGLPWKAHAKALGTLWSQHEKVRLSKVRRWADLHLGAVRAASSTVFYPFGGPDALYATAFFPEESTYVLVGLEPAGTAPDLGALSPEDLAASLKDMETYITPILQISFFRTDDMETELSDKGTVPILVTFLAGTGHRILDVRPVALAADGTPVEAGGPGASRAARIDFVREGGSRVQSLYYFSQNLSDAALKKAPEFVAFLNRMDHPVTFLKAASYLMFRPHFSKVRTFILTRTSCVLQDDSGIPLRCFAPGKWDLQFYGTYTDPIKRFKEFEQKDLVEAYRGAGAVSPLDFGIGYQHHAGQSNLMFAVARGR